MHLTRIVPKKQTTKLSSAKFQNMLCPRISYREFKDLRENSAGPDEVAHNEPPHLDLHCLQIQLFSVLVLSMLRFEIYTVVGNTMEDHQTPYYILC